MLFLGAYFFGMLLSGIAAGTAGPSTTYLTQNITSTSTSMSVRDTSGFDDYGTVTIGQEKIYYNSKSDTQLLNLQRGEEDTLAASHNVLDKVFSDGSAALNDALGFNVAKLSGTGGLFAFPIWGFNLIWNTFPNAVQWDFNFLKEGELQYLRYFLLVCSAAFIIWLVVKIMGVAWGVIDRFF